METKKQYPREEKLVYYAKRIAYLEMAIERNRWQLEYAKKRLSELKSAEQAGATTPKAENE